MNSDFRVAVDFLTHDKTRELRRQLGSDAILCLLNLWAHCATRAIDGRIGDAETVERFADWRGRSGDLVEVLTRLSLIDNLEGEYRVHDWRDHQPYCADAKHRIERARKAGIASASARRERFGTAQPAGGRHEGRSTERSKKIEQPARKDRAERLKKIEPPTQPNQEDLSAVQGPEIDKSKPRRRSNRGAA